MPDRSDLVERREKYIQRQIQLNRGAVNVRFQGMRPQGDGPSNRHGMPRLPIGQHEVLFRHPELGERRVPVTVTTREQLKVGIDLRSK